MKNPIAKQSSKFQVFDSKSALGHLLVRADCASLRSPLDNVARSVLKKTRIGPRKLALSETVLPSYPANGKFHFATVRARLYARRAARPAQLHVFGVKDEVGKKTFVTTRL